MKKNNEVECWGIQLLIDNDLDALEQVLDAARDLDHFVGVVPIDKFNLYGGILLFDDMIARNRAFIELKKFNSLAIQVVASFRSAYVESKYLKRGDA